MGTATKDKKVQIPQELAGQLLSGQITIGTMVGLTQSTLYAIAQVGYGFLQTGNPDKALIIYQGLVAASPRDSVFHCHLAACHVALEQYEEALMHYSESLRFNVKNVDALAGRGELLLRMGKMADAVKHLADAVKADAGKKRPSAQRAAAMLMLLEQRIKKKEPASAEPPAAAKPRPSPAKRGR